VNGVFFLFLLSSSLLPLPSSFFSFWRLLASPRLFGPPPEENEENSGTQRSPEQTERETRKREKPN